MPKATDSPYFLPRDSEEFSTFAEKLKIKGKCH